MLAPAKNTSPFQAPTLKSMGLVPIYAITVPLLFRQFPWPLCFFLRQFTSKERNTRQEFAGQRMGFVVGLK